MVYYGNCLENLLLDYQNILLRNTIVIYFFIRIHVKCAYHNAEWVKNGSTVHKCFS